MACHGRAVMNKAQIAQQVSYLKKLWSEVCRAKAARKTPEEAREGFSEFANLAGAIASAMPHSNARCHI